MPRLPGLCGLRFPLAYRSCLGQVQGLYLVNRTGPHRQSLDFLRVLDGRKDVCFSWVLPEEYKELRGVLAVTGPGLLDYGLVGSRLQALHGNQSFAYTLARGFRKQGICEALPLRPNVSRSLGVGSLDTRTI